MMNSMLNYFLESGLALGVFSLFYLIALKQEKSFTFNRFYLLGCTALALILPLISFRFEGVPSHLVAGTIFLNTVTMETLGNAGKIDLVSYWPLAYGAISAFFLILLVVRTSTLLVKRSQSKRAAQVRLYAIPGSTEAYTFGDTIFIGDQLNADERDMIITHEEVHARDWHTLDILFLEIVGALLWINPFVYIIKRLARINHEYLADAKALHQSNKEEYIQTLASHTIKSQGYQLVHAFYTSSTLKRIKMINQQNNQIMKIKQIAPILLGLGLVLIFGCEDAAEQLSDMNDQEAAAAITQVQTSKVQEAEGMDGVYDLVEVQPLPAEGMTAFYTWIAENMQYPNQARREGVEGRVFIQFIVNENGDITEVKSIKGIGAGCDAEAERVMKSAASWSPGMVDGKPVKVRMIMPITFKLG
ncbi:M56 family metallopeptidase [Reichenbachiella sp.]|uniref:M56 family metallopeptidase n=1 Tax=Reichenbachiella sp. TaxID=2184521 RepID=UPI003BB21578